MEIKIPKVLTAIDLGDYAEALKGQFVHVWVNPPMEVMREHEALRKAQDPNGITAWYVRMFSQHAEAATHWTAAELDALNESDPALLTFLVSAYWQARADHRSKKKKS